VSEQLIQEQILYYRRRTPEKVFLDPPRLSARLGALG
jgi:hypothetical protein